MKIKIVVNLVVLLCICWACDDMNSIFQDYLDQGEKIYIGKPDSVRVLPGNERAKLEWKINADPKLKSCVIYWNNKVDSVVIEIQRATSGSMWMNTVLENLEEKGYVFEFYTHDVYGNVSLKSEKSGEVYGSKYRSKLFNRKITRIVCSDEGAKLIWNYVENSIGIQFFYMNHSGKWQELLIRPTEQEVVIEDYQPGGEYYYVTQYKPTEDCIDVFETDRVSGRFPVEQ